MQEAGFLTTRLIQLKSRHTGYSASVILTYIMKQGSHDAAICDFFYYIVDADFHHNLSGPKSQPLEVDGPTSR